MEVKFKSPLIVCLVLLGLLVQTNLFAGSRDSLKLQGMIFNNTSKIKGVVVNIYDHNKLIKNIHVKSSNRFLTNLPINTLLTIEIKAPDYHTKRFMLDTKIPSNLKSIPKYEFDIDIFKESELAGINTSFLDFPVGLVSYDKKKKVFHRNKKYTKRMKKAYLKLWAESQSAGRQSEGLK
ncbi:MAG: hypothetical protein JKY48_20810 [Flavobacteriales bacterium]|nr:hypothetical protein [Flavobacteriales bacterium]